MNKKEMMEKIDMKKVSAVQARMRHLFTALGVDPETPYTLKVVRATVDPCSVCGAARFWTSWHGATVCTVCHPPVSPRLVAEWVVGESSR